MTMTCTTTDPIHSDWSPFHEESELRASARDVSAMLARFEVADIDPAWVPLLAASAAELASVAGIPWRFSTDDPAVALLRLIAKVTITTPHAAGPHTARLLTQLPSM